MNPEGDGSLASTDDIGQENRIDQEARGRYHCLLERESLDRTEETNLYAKEDGVTPLRDIVHSQLEKFHRLKVRKKRLKRSKRAKNDFSYVA